MLGDPNTHFVPTEYRVLGKLPELFLMNDGKEVQTQADWEIRRKEMLETAVTLQYGTMPPKPEFLDVEALYLSKNWSTYRITTGKRDVPISFIMRVSRPLMLEKNARFPVIVDGDGCFSTFYNHEFVNVPLETGIGIALFDRTEIVSDVRENGRCGGLYDVYPEYTFGALGAWAWGYSRCVDALLKLDLVDPDWIVFSGLSRGAKTAMLAGVLDERAVIVNPQQSCAGSCSCYRTTMQGTDENGVLKRSEELSDLLDKFAFWMGEGMQDYASDPASLPFDAHFLKALIAPRTLLVGEGIHDIWANPLGSWQTSMAAKEAFAFLGVEENLLWYFRDGGHRHTPEDMRMLVNLILHKKNGTPLSNEFFRRPFDEPELLFEKKYTK